MWRFQVVTPVSDRAALSTHTHTHTIKVFVQRWCGWWLYYFFLCILVWLQIVWNSFNIYCDFTFLNPQSSAVFCKKSQCLLNMLKNMNESRFLRYKQTLTTCLVKPKWFNCSEYVISSFCSHGFIVIYVCSDPFSQKRFNVQKLPLTITHAHQNRECRGSFTLYKQTVHSHTYCNYNIGNNALKHKASTLNKKEVQ